MDVYINSTNELQKREIVQVVPQAHTSPAPAHYSYSHWGHGDKAGFLLTKISLGTEDSSCVKLDGRWQIQLILIV